MTCIYFRIIIHSTAYHHLQITWLSYFGSENPGLPLRSWFVTCWLWRHIPIVTSLAVPSSCVVTQTPMGTNSGTRRRKRKFPLLFVNCDRGRIEIDHLYGLRCPGWYCNPEQHSLCRPARPQAAARRPAQLVLFRIAVPTTPAQTVSWSIPIINIIHYNWCQFAYSFAWTVPCFGLDIAKYFVVYEFNNVMSDYVHINANMHTYTVWCRYNAVNFLIKLHKGYSIARLLGRGIGDYNYACRMKTRHTG